MPTTDVHLAPTDGAGPEPEKGSALFTVRSGAYTAVVIAVLLCGVLGGLRLYGVFACGAAGYGADGYLAYCQSRNYGDYDHGAFWFGLEPAAIDAAAKAQVVFIGNSRMQFGLSSQALADWFRSAGVSYYLMGFAYDANHTFEGPLIAKIHPKARVYVVNLDKFFEAETLPIKAVLHDSGAKARYDQKRLWQSVHKSLCTTLPLVCGNEVSFFRSRDTGSWKVFGEGFSSKPVSYDNQVDQRIVTAYSALGQAFLSRLPVPRECVVLTTVPTVNSSQGTARAVASALGLPLVAPELAGLNTFDASHLDQPSAERWSAAFFDDAGAQIRTCLDLRPAPAD
jgi:hypothetical protein